MTAAAPLTFTGETPNPGPASPNPYRDPRPWYTVVLGGRTIKAPLTKYNGLKIEDEWKADKSKNTSGHTPKFGGTKGIENIVLTFRACDADDFDDIGDLYNLMAPVPGSQFTSAPTTTTTTGAISGVGAVGATPTSGTVDPNTGKADPDNAFGAASTATATPEPNPGPRPPTLPIQNAVCAFHGVFAVARKSFELVYLDADNSWECHLGLIQDEPPRPIAAGAMQSPAFASFPTSPVTIAGVATASGSGTSADAAEAAT